MAYGNAQRLGETINPQLMQVDFSPYERAGATTGNAIANIGQQIGGAIKQYGEDEKTIKKAQQMAKSIADAIPELKTMGNNALEQLNNKDLSQRDRLAIAEGIQDSLRIGVMGLENNRSNAMLQLEADKIAAAANKAPQGTFMTTQEFSGLMNSGVPVKGVPMPDGRVFVTDISGNQPGILGSGVAMVNGQPTKIPTTPVNLPSWGAGGNYSNPNDGMDASTLTDEQITALYNERSQAPATTGVGVLPLRPGAVQQSPYVQRVINDVNNGFAYGNTGANVTPPANQGAASVNNGFSMIPNAPVPTGDIYNLQGGQVGVTRLPGSSAELDYQIKEAELKAKEEKAKSEQTISEQTKPASEKQKLSKSNFLIDKANEAETIIKNDISKYGVVGTNFDIGKSKVAGTPEYSLVNQILPALKDSIALSALQKLKDASPTGSSGLGAVTEKEGKRLENMYGVLDVGGDKEILLKDLQRLKEESFDMVHGSKSERNQALKDGRITKEQNDQVEQMYNEQILGRKPRVAMDNPFTLDPTLDQDIDNFLNQ